MPEGLFLAVFTSMICPSVSSRSMMPRTGTPAMIPETGTSTAAVDRRRHVDEINLDQRMTLRAQLGGFIVRRPRDRLLVGRPREIEGVHRVARLHRLPRDPRPPATCGHTSRRTALHSEDRAARAGF